MRELIKVWRRDGFRLSLYDIGQRDSMGKNRLAYRFCDNGKCIFEGNDFACPLCYAIDSLKTVYSLLSFMALRPGDTDSEYFDAYTAEQMEWAQSGRAELLGLLVYEAEEKLGRRRERERDKNRIWNGAMH